MVSDLRVGIVGLGPWGLNLVRAFEQTPRCTVTAVCDIAASRLPLGRARAPSASLHLDLDELLRSNVDAVVVAAPSVEHAELTLRSLAAGKHVFVEKPLSLGIESALAIRNAATARSLRVMVGHILAHHPAIARVGELLGEPGFGVPRLAHCERSSVRATGDEGAWWSLAAHDIAVLHLLFGETALEVQANRDVLRDSRERISAELQFSDARARIVVERPATEKRRQLWLLTTEAEFVFDETDGQLLARSGARRHDPAGWENIAFIEEEPLRREVRHFVDGILEGTEFLTDVRAACEVVAALEAGQLSIDVGAAARVTTDGARMSPSIPTGEHDRETTWG